MIPASWFVPASWFKATGEEVAPLERSPRVARELRRTHGNTESSDLEPQFRAFLFLFLNIFLQQKFPGAISISILSTERAFLPPGLCLPRPAPQTRAAGGIGLPSRVSRSTSLHREGMAASSSALSREAARPAPPAPRTRPAATSRGGVRTPGPRRVCPRPRARPRRGWGRRAPPPPRRAQRRSAALRHRLRRRASPGGIGPAAGQKAGPGSASRTAPGMARSKRPRGPHPYNSGPAVPFKPGPVGALQGEV